MGDPEIRLITDIRDIRDTFLTVKAHMITLSDNPDENSHYKADNKKDCPSAHSNAWGFDPTGVWK